MKQRIISIAITIALLGGLGAAIAKREAIANHYGLTFNSNSKVWATTLEHHATGSNMEWVKVETYDGDIYKIYLDQFPEAQTEHIKGDDTHEYNLLLNINTNYVLDRTKWRVEDIEQVEVNYDGDK